MKSGITIALLAYKEEENLKILLPQIIAVMADLQVDYEIVVVDTPESYDNTKAVCSQFGCRYVNQYYPYFGGAFRTAIECAEHEYFLILDADGSHPPAYITEMYRKFINEKEDVVIGSRYVKGGITKDSRMSIFMSRILNTIFRVALGIKAHDISTDYRIYKTKQLKRVKLESENYDVLQEVLLKIKLKEGRLRVGEVPIVFQKRVYGESKRRLIPFIISYLKSLFRLTYLRFESYRTLLLYGLFGGIAAVVDFLIFAFWIRTGVTAEIANAAGACSGFLFSFLTNTFLNFRKRTRIIKRFFSYAAICLTGACFTGSVLFLLKGYINLYLLKAILLVAVSLAQFLLNKTITYRGED